MKLLPKATYANDEIVIAILTTKHFVHEVSCDTHGFYSEHSPDGLVWYTQLSMLNDDDVHVANCAIYGAKDGGRVEFAEYADYVNSIIGTTLKYIKHGDVWIPDVSNPDGEIILDSHEAITLTCSEQSDLF